MQMKKNIVGSLKNIQPQLREIAFNLHFLGDLMITKKAKNWKTCFLWRIIPLSPPILHLSP